jgi:UrcA family protein
MFRTLIITAALALTPIAAFAGEASQVRVQYSDLNLDSATGVQTLYQRIQQASRELCGPAPLNRDLEQSDAYNQCMDATVRRAVERMHLPALTNLSQGSETVQYAAH